jgi:hypothetical protein
MFGREARASEAERIKKFIANMTAEGAGKPAVLKDAWTQVGLVLLNSNEFVHVP